MPFAAQDAPSPDLIRKTSDLSVRRQCELLGVTRSKVYYTPKSPDEEAIERKERIMALIDYWHTENPTWGARKIRVLLRNDGYYVSRKTVQKYMREMAIYPVYPKPNTSKRTYKEGILPYLLRNYVVQFPNQVWSIDISYIRMKRRHMYLTAIIDWYSRKIVGWKLSDTLEAAPVLEAVREAETLCRHVRCMRRLNPWKIIVISRRFCLSSAGVSLLISTPSITTSPSVGFSSILMHLTSVLFPAPLMPMMPYISPSPMSSVMFFSASTLPPAPSNVLHMFCSFIIF